MDLDALAADEQLTPTQAALVRTYRDYLRDLPMRRTDRRGWHRKWAAYRAGHATGPTTPAQYKQLRTQHGGPA